MDVLDLLAREGLVAKSEVASLRRRAGPVIAAPFDAGLIADDVLADFVAREAGTVVIDLDQGTLEHDAVRLLSEETARQLLAVVVAVEPGGRSVRAAFANPLEDAAISKVAASTGRSVRAMVGTVSGIRRVIDREYGQSATRVMAAAERSRAELAPESTRRVPGTRGRDDDEPIGSDEVPRTLPVHRLEQEATIEQRHEALLLALIEKGVLTRAEYGDALKRLLGRR
ncbi:MAG: hypothetical protein M3Y87_07865 [Myxococcota bacterium]|nr:hypothetical protein [Myxococcota bacterium]